MEQVVPLDRESPVLLRDSKARFRLTSSGDALPGLRHLLLHDVEEPMDGEPPLGLGVHLRVEALSAVVCPHASPTDTPEGRRETLPFP